MRGFVIFDGEGYWVAMRRPNGSAIHLWSTHKKDAARFHFLEAAERIASSIPQTSRIIAA